MPNVTHALFLRPLLALLLGSLCLHAQPTLQKLWTKHDQFVMEGDPKATKVDPSCSYSFKGKQGQAVRGWDVGLSSAPVVLWWPGGPGSKASPEFISFFFSNPEAIRQISIDPPGTGESAWVPDWKPEDTVDDALTFLKLRGITGPVIVVGGSWGSTMSLLFAQRHPEWVRGAVVAGLWTNTPEEVRRYLDADGTRSGIPGLSYSFKAFTTGRGTACDLHEAIRQGSGGKQLPPAYMRAESLQAGLGPNPRTNLIDTVPKGSTTPVDMTAEPNATIRFAYIESEMMCRGQKGTWKLDRSFPITLGDVPLVVIQGRYDQVCDPEVAREIYRAWPSKRKLYVPFNGGHSFFRGPGKDSMDRAGLVLTIDQKAQLERANRLHFGSSYLYGAAVDCLIHGDEEGKVPAQVAVPASGFN